MVTRQLSKSKLIAFRQCPKRLWLEVHRPQLREDSKTSQAIFKTGHEVGELAQRLYDPQGDGNLIDLRQEGVVNAINRTGRLLGGDKPIFEAGFAAEGGMAFADVLLPMQVEGKPGWRMVEVKSSTSVKAYHLDDIAIQTCVARAAGVRLGQVSLAHIDANWVYQGEGDYRGLLIENDLTEQAFARDDEVREWLDQAHAVANMGNAPEVAPGLQCAEPFSCGFIAYCQQQQAVVEYPVTWLPRIQSQVLKTYIRKHAVTDMRDVPDALLNERQRLVRDCTLQDECFFDEVGAQQDLARYPLPAYFLDFETIQFGVPRWTGTRPFQSVPFQFSLHHLDASGTLSHETFLDVSGHDPSLNFAQSLVAMCAADTPIFVYNSGFEGRRILDLADRFPALRDQLLAVKSCLVDLLPVAQARFYHPSQRGSWSLKKVLPAVASSHRHDQLIGVQDGDMAMQAYLEAIDESTTAVRRQEIRDQLLAYCALDTLAMVEIWGKFVGRRQ